MKTEELKKAAQAATPGQWIAANWTCHAPTTVKTADGAEVIAETTGFGRHSSECAADAAFIARANPAAVLDLIASYEQLIATLRKAEEALAHCYNVTDFPGDGTSDQDVALAEVRAALTAVDA